MCRMPDGSVRPEVVALDRVIAAGFVTACLTSNVSSKRSSTSSDDHARPEVDGDGSIRPCDRIEQGRLPQAEPELYEPACAAAGSFPSRSCHDDLGINRPGRSGMTTIKVLSAQQAIDDLEAALSSTSRCISVVDGRFVLESGLGVVMRSPVGWAGVVDGAVGET